MTDRLGQHFGSYQFVKVLGQGGCAKVYLGKHHYLNSYAALKVWNATLSSGDKYTFLNEAQRLADLRHPNIVHLLDFGMEDETPVLIMEYAPKGSLRQYYPNGAQMLLSTVVDFTAQVATALQYAHNHHVIHCDVKPENILLDADDRLLLSDFGISLLTLSSQQSASQDQAGTAWYMAPEQWSGRPCFASDQYALAVMVYEWLCGAPPFLGNVWEVSQKHLSADPPPIHFLRPELPVLLEQVVLRALSKKPQERFSSVQAFALALARACQMSTPAEEQDPEITLPMPAILSSSPFVLFHPATALPSQGEQTHLPPLLSPVSTLEHLNRMRLLQRVRSFWITGVLEQSLYGASLVALGLQEQADAVANPWRLIVQESEHPSFPLPAGISLTEVYDAAGGELLILGEPGAGKTTLLLALTRDLLDRAQQEQTHPIPVVFNLSSWRRKQQSLATWLIEELETKYQVPTSMAVDWITANQILPLLDGLDEVDGAFRSACLQAINDYHQTHSLVPLVVCCRVSDYRSQTHQLTLDRAVTIQPLTSEQIHLYLACLGNRAAALSLALQHDPVLQELATTPLMLTILIMVYQDSSLEEIQGVGSAEARREQIFATYTQRMLQRRQAPSRYAPQQTLHWLSSLAQQMKRQSQTVFHLERMQPTWLEKTWQRRLYYGLLAGPICGLLLGLESLGTILPFPLMVLAATLIFGSLFGWFSEPPETANKNLKMLVRGWLHLRQRLATFLESQVKIGVVAGLFFGLSTILYLYLGDFHDWSWGSRILGTLSGGLPNGIFAGLCVGLATRLERRIEPVEVPSWSWSAIRRDTVKWLLIGVALMVGLIFELSLLTSHDEKWAHFLAFGPSTAFQLLFVVVLVSGITQGLSKRTLDAQHIVTPNQGIWRSMRYGATMALITGGITAICSGASDFFAYFWLPPHITHSFIKPYAIDKAAVSIMGHLLLISPTPTAGQAFWTLHALFWAMIDGAIPALAVGLSCGGSAYLQHFVLRFLLWCTRSAPFNYVGFLDYAAERILLHKVGGGYIFIHRLLLEHFAEMETGTMLSSNASHQKDPLPLPVSHELHAPEPPLNSSEAQSAPTSSANASLQKDPLPLPVSHELHTLQTPLNSSLAGFKEPEEQLKPIKQEIHPGQQVGEYRLIRKLGGGSYGSVYLGEHVYEHTQVAVKVLQIPLNSRKDFKEFINEARTTRLHHPHIVPLLDFGISRDDLPFLVMEYAPEGTLRDLHPPGERVALSTLISYVEQLASALQYAHDHRVIHRDIKPENILIRSDGTLMISDFGLATLLEQNVGLSRQRQAGTPVYMPPEQQKGFPCFASDQYALGVVIYEWLCGVRPFDGIGLVLAIQHLHISPPSLRDQLPDLPEVIEQVIFKALAKAPENRFKRIQEFSDALHEAVQVSLAQNTIPPS